MFNAFISYSHSADDKFAPLLQDALQKFAKPWYKKRNLEIFRDESSLSASPHLWENITKALDRSEYLILLASSLSENSHWVNEEVKYWLKHKSVETILLVLTEGEISWDIGNIRFLNPDYNSLPPSLDYVFKDEPFYIDLRQSKTYEDLSLDNPIFKKEILKLAAKLHNKTPNDLASEEVTMHRKMIRIRNGTIAILFLLICIIIGAFWQANKNAGIAKTNEKVAFANTLIAEANKFSNTNINKAFLLYYYAYEANPTIEMFNILNNFFIGNKLVLPLMDIEVPNHVIINSYPILNKIKTTSTDSESAIYLSSINNCFYEISDVGISVHSLNAPLFSKQYDLPLGYNFISADSNYLLFEKGRKNFKSYVADVSNSELLIFDIKTQKFLTILPKNFIVNSYKKFNYGLSNGKLCFFSRDTDKLISSKGYGSFEFKFYLTIVDISSLSSNQYYFSDKHELLGYEINNIVLSELNDFIYFNSYTHNRFDYSQSFMASLTDNLIIYKTQAINTDLDGDFGVIKAKFSNDNTLVEAGWDGIFSIREFVGKMESKNWKSSDVFKGYIENFVITDNYIFAINKENFMNIYVYNPEYFTKGRRDLNEIILMKSFEIPFENEVTDLEFDTLTSSLFISNDAQEIYKLQFGNNIILKQDINILKNQVKKILGFYDLQKEEKIRLNLMPK